MKDVICESCYDVITSREDLVVTTNFLSIVPYHRECYADEMKSSKSFFIGKPLNSSNALFMTILTNVFAIVMTLYLYYRVQWSFLFLIIILVPVIEDVTQLYVHYRYVKQFTK